MKVSVFKNFLNGERITACGVDELVRIIRDGDYADAISDYRCASPRMLSVGRGGEARQWAVDTADNRIPRLCFASEYRRLGGVRRLVGRNGLVLLEIDNLADFPTAVSLRNEAARQPFTMMAFVGANGRSVEVVCCVVAHDGVSDSDATAYVRMMTEGARRLHYVYSSQLGVNISVQAQADDTMCLMSADAGVYYAPVAVAFTVDLSNPVAAYRAADVRDVDESPLPGKSRDEAYRYIFYSCWDSVLDSGLSLDDALFEERAISLLARYCRHSGLPQQMCVDRAMTLDLINRDGELITLLFNQAYGNNLVHANPTAYVPLPALTAMKTDHFMRKRFRLRRNVLTGVTQYKPLGAYDTYYRPVTQEVINAIATMAQREGIRVWARDIKERVNSELVEPYDPVNDYIASLPEWDGRDRLKAFAARVPTDNPYWTEFFSVWMRSMVAHWMGLDSNHGNALVPLLIGRQGCGKTSFTKIILPEPLQPYQNDRIDFKNDNAVMLGLSSFALINIDEFDRYSVRRQPLMKYLFSKGDVTAIKAYGRTFTTERRYASFIGTTNSPCPLTDPTGSRRFICANVTGDIDFTSPVAYDQLYAQLVGEIRHGYAYYLDTTAELRLMEYNRRFLRHNNIDEVLQSMFRQPEEGEAAQELTASEIAAVVCGECPDIPPSRVTAVEIGRRLKACGYKGRHTEHGTCYMIKRIKV